MREDADAQNNVVIRSQMAFEQVALHEFDTRAGRRQGPGAIKHLRGEIDERDVVALNRERERERSIAAPQIEDAPSSDIRQQRTYQRGADRN